MTNGAKNLRTLRRRHPFRAPQTKQLFKRQVPKPLKTRFLASHLNSKPSRLLAACFRCRLRSDLLIQLLLSALTTIRSLLDDINLDTSPPEEFATTRLMPTNVLKPRIRDYSLGISIANYYKAAFNRFSEDPERTRWSEQRTQHNQVGGPRSCFRGVVRRTRS